MKIKIATGGILLYMRALGFYAWTSLWGVAYFRPGYENSATHIAHERKHLEQMERDGKIVFMIKYIYWTLRHGYKGNPYEIEARAAVATALSLML